MAPYAHVLKIEKKVALYAHVLKIEKKVAPYAHVLKIEKKVALYAHVLKIKKGGPSSSTSKDKDGNKNSKSVINILICCFFSSLVMGNI